MESQAYLTPHDDFTPPPKRIVRFLYRPLKAYFDPVFRGMENVSSDQPALYVGNHTIFGLTDGPLYGAEFYLEKDVFLRTLVDDMHRSIPVSRGVMTDYGAVYGSREHCAALMDQQQHILVFPGGTREVCKKRDELYTLVWKQRYGFVKMAIEHGYPIIPIAGIGGDDLYDIRVDSNDVMTSPVGDLLHFTGLDQRLFKDGEHIPPLATGIGLTPIPKPGRIYYQVQPPIHTTDHAGRSDDRAVLQEVRAQVEASLNAGMHDLQQVRSEDEVPAWRRFLADL